MKKHVLYLPSVPKWLVSIRIGCIVSDLQANMDSSLLNDATSSDDSPTPGYQLSEIARK